MASGTSANALFGAWTISDVYYGCGAFANFAVSSDATTLSYLSFPEPGYSLAGNCYAPNLCLAIRVNTNVIRINTFNLLMYAQYSQNPVSIPYVVDVCPCLSHAYLNLVANPPSILITKVWTANSWAIWQIEPTYKNYFSYNYAVECPILRYTIEDTAGNPWTYPYVSLVGGTTPASASFQVRNDVSFSAVSFRLRATTMLRTQY